MSQKSSGVITRTTRTFLAFMFSLLLLMLLSLFSIQKTLLNPNFMSQQAKKSDYYTQVTAQVVREIQDLGLASNLPEKALEQSVVEKRVQKDFDQFIRSIYAGKPFTIDQTSFQNDLKEIVMNYAKSQQIEVTPESEKAIDNFTKEAYTRYSAYIKLPYLSEFGRRVISFKRYMMMAYVVIAISLFVISGLLIWQLSGWWHRLYRYLSYSFIATGLMLIIAPSYLIWTQGVKNLAITSKPLYDFITMYLHQFMLTFVYFGVGTLVIGLLLIFFGEFKRKRI